MQLQGVLLPDFWKFTNLIVRKKPTGRLAMQYSNHTDNLNRAIAFEVN